MRKTCATNKNWKHHQPQGYNAIINRDAGWDSMYDRTALMEELPRAGREGGGEGKVHAM